jgi:uncharacterized protein (TIGR02265 family)
MQSVGLQAQTVDLTAIARELDLEWRLANIPAKALTRGIHFNGLREEVRRRRLAGVPRLNSLLATPRRSYALYPVAELVEAAAIAGALAHADPRTGMRELFRGYPAYATKTWYGRVFTKYLAPGPVTALHWLEVSHDYIENYGQWRLERRGPHHVIMHHVDEYLWLDALRGACEGMLMLCGATAEVEVETDGPFDGRFVIRWS